MRTRESDNAPGRDRTQTANIMPVSLHAEARKAFREWLDASKAWSTMHGIIAEDGDSPTARRRLAELEQRAEAAAEAFQQAKKRCSESPLYTAMLYAAISGYK